MSYNVLPDNGALTYMGRTEIYNGMPRFVFAGTSVTVRFKGMSISCRIINHRFFNIQELGTVVDGRLGKISFGEKSGELTLTLAEGMLNTEHEVTLFKRQDASHYFEFAGFELNDGAELLPAKPVPSRRMECYGDSVSAGAVVEAVEYTASNDPEGHNGTYDNSWYAYPMITARNLGAEINNIAQGGISIFNNTGWYHAPDYIGMETAYNKVCYFPEAEGGYSDWDFTRYTPHIVIFAVGQNDPHNPDNTNSDIEEPEYRERWKTGYKRIILDLRAKYPKAMILLTLTVLCHDIGWENAVDEIAAELADPRTVRFKFTRSGRATPGHPRIYEQYEMAEELTRYISSLGDSVWED